MIEFYKKHFEDYDMNIIDTWDQPRVREFKGKLVKGRYTMVLTVKVSPTTATPYPP